MLQELESCCTPTNTSRHRQGLIRITEWTVHGTVWGSVHENAALCARVHGKVWPFWPAHCFPFTTEQLSHHIGQPHVRLSLLGKMQRGAGRGLTDRSSEPQWVNSGCMVW